MKCKETKGNYKDPVCGMKVSKLTAPAVTGASAVRR
jgi:hypothetical protein